LGSYDVRTMPGDGVAATALRRRHCGDGIAATALPSPTRFVNGIDKLMPVSILILSREAGVRSLSHVHATGVAWRRKGA
jgi:hypothetical protein